jgi:hypothetical protein
VEEEQAADQNARCTKCQCQEMSTAGSGQQWFFIKVVSWSYDTIDAV